MQRLVDNKGGAGGGGGGGGGGPYQTIPRMLRVSAAHAGELSTGGFPSTAHSSRCRRHALWHLACGSGGHHSLTLPHLALL